MRAGTRIAHADFESATFTALFKAGFVTLEEIAQLTEDELLGVDYIGPTRAAKVIEVLVERGLSLRTEHEED